jgi:hypothetical protein
MKSKRLVRRCKPIPATIEEMYEHRLISNRHTTIMYARESANVCQRK